MYSGTSTTGGVIVVTSSPGSSWLTFVLGSVIVTFPVGSTTTVLPGFAFSTDSFTLSCSSFVNSPGVTTGTFVSGNPMTNTGTSTVSVLPSPYVTLTTTFVGPPTSVGTSPTTSFLAIVLSVTPSGNVTAAVTSSFDGLC